MGQPLRNEPTDRRMAELEAYATEVFGDADAASAWLSTRLWELANLSREAIARSGENGFERVRDVLLRIEYGVYS